MGVRQQGVYSSPSRAVYINQLKTGKVLCYPTPCQIERGDLWDGRRIHLSLLSPCGLLLL